MRHKLLRDLESDHSTAAIRHRLALPQRHSYLGDSVLGGIDGCITTFAIVASCVGIGLPNMAVLILGFANLAADGFSMAASNYQAAKSRDDHLKATRCAEEAHITLVPQGEKEEVRQIFANKGFEGDVLEQIVEVITSDKALWIDTMLKDEHGLQTQVPRPVYAGAATFTAFILVGLLPLIPFMIPTLNKTTIFSSSAAIALLVFFAIGAIKGVILRQSAIYSGIQTLLVGGAAATLAYFIGDMAKGWIAGL
jgi:VIT1/CCC1 family predicted Fe2+/Mn2+ transporter